MRQQTGTSGLRALVYFDEIMGYLPPVSNPSSKTVILRLLKQARAFGVGLLLATQNPIDVDYKALSNAGTWFIGKLQTDQDKQRLLDGLEGVAGGMDRNRFDNLISSLGKRVFLLHNVHESAPSHANPLGHELPGRSADPDSNSSTEPTWPEQCQQLQAANLLYLPDKAGCDRPARSFCRAPYCDRLPALPLQPARPNLNSRVVSVRYSCRTI